jgi:hypothetical protein
LPREPVSPAELIGRAGASCELERRVGLLDHDRVVRGADGCGAALERASSSACGAFDWSSRAVGSSAEQEHGLGGDRARDRDALAFAGGEPVGAMVEPRAKADLGQRRLGVAVEAHEQLSSTFLAR